MKIISNKGFTLIELIIALMLGIIVIGSVGTVYLSTIKSSSSVLKMAKLNYEMNTLMSMMVSDIRRSGYNQGTVATSIQDNIFNQVTSSTDMDTALSLRSVMNNTTQIPASSNTAGQCILYAYDKDLDGVVDNDELFGYRLNGSMVEMRAAVANAAAIVADTAEDSCTNGTWYPLTDNTSINFTNLSFSLASSTCLNTTQADGADGVDADTDIDDDDEINCYNAAHVAVAGDITVEVRMADITMTAQMVSDTTINTTISNSVRVRNDLVRER